MKRKLFAVLCSIVLCMTSVSAVFATDVSSVNFDGDSVYAASYYKDIDQAAASLRKSMTEREINPVILFHMESTEVPDVQSIIEEIFKKACEHTGKSNEGDALLWDWKTWDCNVVYHVVGNEYKFEFHYTLVYYSNAEQEKIVKAEISKLKNQLKLDGKTDIEKITAIYDYICTHVDYDYTNLNNPDYDLKFTAYAALMNKTSVCQGYAALFYRLALECGIDARVISGTSFGSGHGWNIVKLGSQYYYLDATWDSHREPYAYFLKGKDFLKKDHTCSPEYLTAAFTKKYPIAENDYSFNSNSDKPVVTPTPEEKPVLEQKPDNVVPAIGTVKLSAEKSVFNGKTKSPKLVVKDINGVSLKKGTDYKVTVPKGRKNVGKYVYVVGFIGKYKAVKDKKLTYTICPVKPVLQSVKSSNKKVSVKWKPVKKQADGYQIMLSTDKKFKKNIKKTFVKGSKKSSCSISKLKVKKTYYVKIRTYKVVKGVKIYSNWSKMKSVKVK